MADNKRLKSVDNFGTDAEATEEAADAKLSGIQDSANDAQWLAAISSLDSQSTDDAGHQSGIDPWLILERLSQLDRTGTRNWVAESDDDKD